MSSKSASSAPSLSVQQIATEFRRTGWVSLWTQVVLVIISSVILLVAAGSTRKPMPNPMNPGVTMPAPPNPSSGIGGVLALCAIALVGFSIYWAFRYVRLGRQLRQASPKARPKRSEAIQMLRTGLLASLAGMLSALLGTFAIVGSLAVIAFQQSPGFVNTNFQQFVNSLDILVVQASINLILAHFVGLAGSLWLLNRMSR